MTAQTAEELAAQIEQEQVEAKKTEVRFGCDPCSSPSRAMPVIVRIGDRFVQGLNIPCDELVRSWKVIAFSVLLWVLVILILSPNASSGYLFTRGS
uniref:Uncharacterized protein n=1 Tax=Aegilops tauschii subsp. strangulata TaxID=200361 RepID=A0A453I2Q7_AEGTS